MSHTVTRFNFPQVKNKLQPYVNKWSRITVAWLPRQDDTRSEPWALFWKHSLQSMWSNQIPIFEQCITWTTRNKTMQLSLNYLCDCEYIWWLFDVGTCGTPMEQRAQGRTQLCERGHLTPIYFCWKSTCLYFEEKKIW